MEALTITKQQARRFLLAYHGLSGKQMFVGKQGILEYIHRVGCIQFDPLNIVGHNHELVLQSRISGFKPNMLQELLFDFEYRWEVYKPASERSYGYYVLPVLYGDNFVARFEPGWDKKTNTMIIKNWWWEPDIKSNKIMKEELRKCFEKFINFMDAEHIRLENKAVEIKGLDWLL